MQRVLKLPADDEVGELVAELKSLNPGCSGIVVADKGIDLSLLEGMPLTVFVANDTNISDISPFAWIVSFSQEQP